MGTGRDLGDFAHFHSIIWDWQSVEIAQTCTREWFGVLFCYCLFASMIRHGVLLQPFLGFLTVGRSEDAFLGALSEADHRA